MSTEPPTWCSLKYKMYTFGLSQPVPFLRRCNPVIVQAPDSICAFPDLHKDPIAMNREVQMVRPGHRRNSTGRTESTSVNLNNWMICSICLTPFSVSLKEDSVGYQKQPLRKGACEILYKGNWHNHLEFFLEGVVESVFIVKSSVLSLSSTLPAYVEGIILVYLTTDVEKMVFHFSKIKIFNYSGSLFTGVISSMEANWERLFFLLLFTSYICIAHLSSSEF